MESFHFKFHKQIPVLRFLWHDCCLTAVINEIYFISYRCYSAWMFRGWIMSASLLFVELIKPTHIPKQYIVIDQNYHKT